MRGLRAASELSKEFSIGTCIYEVNEDPENFFNSIILEMFHKLNLTHKFKNYLLEIIVIYNETII